MKAAAGSFARTLPGPYVRVLGPLALVTILATAVAGAEVGSVTALVAVLAIRFHESLTSWRSLLIALIGVILFIPIGRYTVPANLPFQLEPYRIFVGCLLLVWVSSLLIDRRVRLRLGVLGPPLLILFLTVLASDVANPGRIHHDAVGSIVVKKLTFFASFLLVYLLMTSVIRRARDVHAIVKVLVVGGSALAVSGLIEYATGYNLFNHLQSFVPLRALPLPYSIAKGAARLRVYATSQHPIALGALFAILVPLSAYLWHTTRQRRWWGAAALLLLGTFATQSRTAFIMLIVVGLVLLRQRPRAMRRLWPLLLPLFLAVHLAVPGSIGALANAFFPKGGLIAQQEAGAGTYGSGRVADLGPSLREYSASPVLGEGFGTRVTDKGPLMNANILDDQWLGTLLETGAVGTFLWVWTFARFIRRVGRAARDRDDPSPRGWLCAALTAGIFAFSVGMVTFDAFSFIQVTFIVFLLLGLGSAVVEIPTAEWRALRTESAVRQ